jgi:hypothetical protein
MWFMAYDEDSEERDCRIESGWTYELYEKHYGALPRKCYYYYLYEKRRGAKTKGTVTPRVPQKAVEHSTRPQTLPITTLYKGQRHQVAADRTGNHENTLRAVIFHFPTPVGCDVTLEAKDENGFQARLKMDVRAQNTTETDSGVPAREAGPNICKTGVAKTDTSCER